MHSIGVCLLLIFALQLWAVGEVDWPRVQPNAARIDQNALAGLSQELSSDPHRDIKGVVILRNHNLVAEYYFNGDDANTLHDIRSATKSITATLLGIAIRRHLIASVNDSISNYLPSLPRDGKQKIAIRDLLNMRSGLDVNDDDPSTPGNESRLDSSTDWIKAVYAVPMKSRPGQKYVYCSINAFILGVIVENASKQNLDVFAEKTLFRPLGIGAYKWRRVPVNRTAGQGNLSITTRDEARIGELYLNDGIFGGQHLVDKTWIDKSIENQIPISSVDPYADYYGYMWYSKDEQVGERKILVHFASGNGGNKIYVIPSLNMVVAITSSAYNQKYGQRRSQDILLRVLAATQP
jgi:CubicO group peptidase (beta-lactamase class C family)